MSEHLRDRLLEEMDGRQRPPVDDLVTVALQRGRRQRRARRVAAGAGTTAVVGVTVLAVGLGASLSPNRGASRAGISAGSTGTAAAPVALATTPVASQAPAVTPAPTTTTAATDPTPIVPAAVGTSKDGKIAAAQAWHAVQAAESAANPPHWTDASAGVPSTPQGELQLFKELAKPYGEISAPGVSQDAAEADGTHVRANLTTPDGKVGEVQFYFEHDTLGQAADCMKPPASFLEEHSGYSGDAVACHSAKDGGYVIVDVNKNRGCLNAAEFTVVHPDGTAVVVSVASCFTDFGNTMHDGSQPLTEAQAEEIFTDPRFDFTMPQDLVKRGASFGQLKTFW